MSRVAASTRFNISTRKILAFEKQRCAMSFRAGIGEAIAEIKLRRVSTFAVSLETFDRQPTDTFVDSKLGDFTLQKKIVKEILSGNRWNVEAACENHACFKSHGRGSQSATSALELTDKR
jgi:hypothetical protein